MDYIYINDVEFIDNTDGAEGARVYSLVSEALADTVGVYGSEETAADAVQRLVKDAGKSTKEFWGTVYVIDRDL